MVETSQDFRVFWLKVILRAQEEAEGKFTYWDENPGEIIQAAKDWLSTPSPDLSEICSFAGFGPDQTVRLVEDSRRKYGRNAG